MSVASYYALSGLKKNPVWQWSMLIINLINVSTLIITVRELCEYSHSTLIVIIRLLILTARVSTMLCRVSAMWTTQLE